MSRAATTSRSKILANALYQRFDERKRQPQTVATFIREATPWLGAAFRSLPVAS